MTDATTTRPAAVQLKIIYGGPAEAGKTTSLVAVANIFSRFRLDDVLVVQTTGGRTLWNEYAAFQFTIPQRTTRVDIIVHLSALTGQERFLNTRKYAAPVSLHRSIHAFPFLVVNPEMDDGG